MGLAVVVGVFADLDQTDPEATGYYRGLCDQVNEVLAENGLPSHHEPEKLALVNSRCSLLSYPYSFLHYLRRAYALRVENPTWQAEPLDADADPSGDPAVERQSSRMSSHLLCHSDAEGLYLPIDFQPVLFDEHDRVPGGLIGSSFRLRDELVFVAPALGIQLDGNAMPDAEANAINDSFDRQEGIWIERIVWLSLFEAARLSINHGAAICFS
jgi:hypothetical protein